MIDEGTSIDLDDIQDEVLIEEEPETPVEQELTSFKEMYDFFLAGITDDMFMELTIEDTKEILLEILTAALPHIEFPQQDIFDLDFDNQCFNVKLSSEEKMIIRQYMISEWIGYQLATIDLIKQKYSGSDWKFTSQASHLKQLTTLKKEYETKGFHLQRLMNRHKRHESGKFVSTFGIIMQPTDDVYQGRETYGEYRI